MGLRAWLALKARSETRNQAPLALVVAAALLLPWSFANLAQAANEAPQEHSTEATSQAAALVRNHQWDEGLALLGPVLKAEPRNLQALNLAGLALTGKGETQEADRYFEKALTIDPHFLAALKNLAINEFNAGELTRAERHLALALKESPGDPVVNLFAGQLAYRKNDFAKAAETLPKAQPFVSRDPELAVQLAISYLSVGQQKQALDLLGSIPSSQLSPSSQFLLGVKLAGAGFDEAAVPFLNAARGDQANSLNATYDLAVCYLNLKRYSDAASVLAEMTTHGHETSDLDNLLAEAYEGDHETQKAIDALRRAIALAPEEESNYLDFASLCIDHQDYPAAQKVLDVGLQVHPRSDQLYFERGILHAIQDNFRLAEEDFKHATALSPERSANYKGLGILYLESGHSAQATETLKHRLKEKPNDPELLYLLGESLLRSGAQPGDATYREAQAAFERSVQFDAKASLPRVSLGKMYLEQGRTQEAVTELEEAKAADPKEKSVYWQLANAYRKLGESAKQKQVLTELKELNDQERSGTRARNSQMGEFNKPAAATAN